VIAAESQPKTGPLRQRPNVELSNRRRWVVTAGVMLGMFLAALEVTVVGTAMPTIIAKLGGLDRYSWIFSAYLLTSTVTVPLWGRLSDLYGRRPLYLAGIALFLVGSALSGASASFNQLIAFRSIQGLGAGALVPLSLTITGDIFTMRERARMQGVFSAVFGIASIIGPLAGGFITDSLSWRWVFYINIPFGLAATVIVGVALVEPKRVKHPIIDYAGALWLTIAVTSLLILLVESGDTTAWTKPIMLVPLAGFPLFAYLFVRTERRAPEPVIPFSLFSQRLVSVGSITSFLVGTAMFGAISFIPLFVQGPLGGTATQAGSVLTPFLLGWVLLSIVGGRLMLRVGHRPTVLAGLVVLTASFAILSTLGKATARWQLLGVAGMMGAGMGLVMLALLLTMQNSVDRGQLGIVTSLNQFSRSIGGAVGVAVMGAVLTLSLNSHMKEIQSTSGLPEEYVARMVHNPSAIIEPGSRGSLPREIVGPLNNALADSLENVFLVGCAFAALALLSGFWLPSKPITPVLSSETVASSAADCERLLMAEMTTIDAEHEPAPIAQKT
jgi:EmrB/QacA subfamily drug resistance transporter